MNIQEIIDSLNREIATRESLKQFIIWHAARFHGLPEPHIYHHQIDFDNCDREQIVRVVKAFPGRWDKSPNPSQQTRIDYETEFDGVKIRLWQGEPPPSCKLVEEEIEVPETIVPAHKVKRVRMVCGETETA